MDETTRSARRLVRANIRAVSLRMGANKNTSLSHSFQRDMITDQSDFDHKGSIPKQHFSFVEPYVTLFQEPHLHGSYECDDGR